MTPDPVGPDPDVDAPVAPLACGRDPALLWDRVAEGAPPDAHERGCPHCTAARADAQGLDAVVHRMAGQELDPPASVLERVMGAVVAELRPHELLTLPSPHGPARLSTLAAAAVVRRVVDGMDGLRARGCRITQGGHGAAGDPHALDVRIGVAARFGLDLATATARVRQVVVAAGTQALGLPVRRVDIEVVDLFDEEDRS